VAWVYILRCCDGSLYVGHTDDVERREREHQEGRGGGYTRKRRPVRVVYQEEFPTVEVAIDREHQIKRWSGKKKEALIASDTQILKLLSRSHQKR
jgi:tRNA/rRNA methyltransferase